MPGIVILASITLIIWIIIGFQKFDWIKKHDDVCISFIIFYNYYFYLKESENNSGSISSKSHLEEQSNGIYCSMRCNFFEESALTRVTIYSDITPTKYNCEANITPRSFSSKMCSIPLLQIS